MVRVAFIKGVVGAAYKYVNGGSLVDQEDEKIIDNIPGTSRLLLLPYSNPKKLECRVVVYNDNNITFQTQCMLKDQFYLRKMIGDRKYVKYFLYQGYYCIDIRAVICEPDMRIRSLYVLSRVSFSDQDIVDIVMNKNIIFNIMVKGSDERDKVRNPILLQYSLFQKKKLMFFFRTQYFMFLITRQNFHTLAPKIKLLNPFVKYYGVCQNIDMFDKWRWFVPAWLMSEEIMDYYTEGQMFRSYWADMRGKLNLSLSYSATLRIKALKDILQDLPGSEIIEYIGERGKTAILHGFRYKQFRDEKDIDIVDVSGHVFDMCCALIDDYFDLLRLAQEIAIYGRTWHTWIEWIAGIHTFELFASEYLNLGEIPFKSIEIFRTYLTYYFFECDFSSLT